MVRTQTPRRALELQSKGKRPMGRPGTRWFSQVLNTSQIVQRAGEK